MKLGVERIKEGEIVTVRLERSAREKKYFLHSHAIFSLCLSKQKTAVNRLFMYKKIFSRH